MRLDPDLMELLAAQAAHDLASLAQMTVVSAYLDGVERSAAARRVITFADSARDRALTLTRYLVADTRTSELRGEGSARLRFSLPADAIELVLERTKQAQQRLRDIAGRADRGAGPELPGEVATMLREIDAMVVELEIMSGCQAVQEGGERLTEPAPTA